MLSGKKLIGFIIAVCMVENAGAQLFAPAASDSFDAIYDNTHQVFVFNRPEYQAPVNASILALSPDRTSGWTFSWYRYNPLTLTYVSIPPAGSGSTSVLSGITASGGYQVIVTKGAISNTYRAWVILNDLQVEITNKTSDDTLQFGYYACGSVDFRADTIRPPLYYYNPNTGARINAPNGYIIRWTTDNPDAQAPPNRLLTRATDLPWQDTWYKITITDNFGLSRSDSVIYNSIESHASITSAYIPLSDETYYPNRNYEDFYEDDILSAPGKFRFDLSGSKNYLNYELSFGDGDTVKYIADSVSIVHEYLKAGKYKVVLMTKSSAPFECRDSISLEVELAFASQDNFSIPNVFTPNKGENVFKAGDIFRSTDVSVVNIEITIFTRTGLKVHQYKGNIRDWQGWDGKILDSGREAPTGVYFYVISRLGAYEDQSNPIENSLMRGFLHLYR